MPEATIFMAYDFEENFASTAKHMSEKADAYVAALPPLAVGDTVSLLLPLRAEDGTRIGPDEGERGVVTALHPEDETIEVVFTGDQYPDGSATFRYRRKALTIPLRFVDHNGHNGYEPGILHDLEADLAITEIWSPKRNYAEYLTTSFEEAERYRVVLGFAFGTRDLRCGECGKPLTYRREGDRAIAETACAYPGGLKPYRVLVNVPSGKIVFANDLRDLIVCDDPEGASVNYQIGQKLVTEAYGRTGLAHVFVGNSCPGVFRDGDALVVANRWIDEESDIDEETYARLDAELDAKRLGSICTDLWWYSAMDHDHFLTRCAIEEVDPADVGSYFIVEVPPGVYAFTDELPKDRDGNDVLYSRIFKVDEPAPAIDDGSREKATCFVDSFLWREMSKPRPYSGTGLGYLEYVLCTLGNGRRWVAGELRNIHRGDDESYLQRLYAGQRKSLKDYKPRKDSPINLVPTFKAFETRIYPLSWDYPGAIGRAPYDIEPYTLVAGMMLMKSALANPSCFDFGGDREKDERRRRHTQAHQAAIATKVLAMLCEIASRRGLFASGAVKRMGAEIQAALDSLPKPEPKSWADLG